MDLRVFTEPQQGATFAQLLAMAQLAEKLGFSGFFRSDHYLFIGEGTPGPGLTDAWVTIGAIAAKTSRIRVGTLMTSATFRLPGPLAVAVAQVDQMSGGRVDLGIGAGWYEREHRALGIPFPNLRDRFDRLEEQLEILQGLWTTPEGRQFDHEGRHYRLEHWPVLSRPAQRPHPPIIIGGYGKARTPRLAARFAAEFNMPGPDVQQVVEQFARARRGLPPDRTGPGEPRQIGVAHSLHRPGPSRVRSSRVSAIGREPDGLRRAGIAGPPPEAKAALERYREAGVRRVYLQFLDVEDLDHVELAAEVLGVGS